jgi:hypothetical protein
MRYLLVFWLFVGLLVFLGSKQPNRCRLSFPTNKWSKSSKNSQKALKSTKISQNLPKSIMADLLLIAILLMVGLKVYNIFTGKDK